MVTRLHLGHWKGSAFGSWELSTCFRCITMCFEWSNSDLNFILQKQQLKETADDDGARCCCCWDLTGWGSARFWTDVLLVLPTDFLLLLLLFDFLLLTLLSFLRSCFNFCNVTPNLLAKWLSTALCLTPKCTLNARLSFPRYGHLGHLNGLVDGNSWSSSAWKWPSDRWAKNRKIANEILVIVFVQFPQRLKSTFFENFSNATVPKGPVEWRFFLKYWFLAFDMIGLFF